MRTNHKLLQVLVVCSLASVALNVAADAADTWVAYRAAVGLPLDPQPSRPEEKVAFAGPVPDAPATPLDAEREKALGNGNGNGNGNGSGLRHCDPFLNEMARSDGGEHRPCD